MAGKLGIGIYTHGNAEEGLALAMDAANSGARLCLVFRDALKLSGSIAALNPDMLIIGRPDLDDAYSQEFMDKPADELRAYVRGLVVTYPKVRAWAIFCEQIPGARGDSPEEKAEQYQRLRRQVRAELVMADELHKLERGLVACNCATGTYPMPEFADISDEWARIIEPLTLHPGCWFWGLHAYGTPEDVCPGSGGRMSSGNDGQRGYYALRYRHFHDAMTARGVIVPPFVFTEYGQTDGWKGIISEDEARADMVWFGAQIADDPRVFGGTEYLHGDHDPAKWWTFDSKGTGVYDALVAFNREHPAVDAWKPSPTVPVVPQTVPQMGGATMELHGAFAGFGADWDAKAKKPPVGKATSAPIYLNPSNTDGQTAIMQYVEGGKLEYNVKNQEVCFFPKAR